MAADWRSRWSALLPFVVGTAPIFSFPELCQSPLINQNCSTHQAQKMSLRINPIDMSIPKQDTDMSTLNFKSIHKGFRTFKHLILDLYSGAVRQGRFIFLDFLPISRTKFVDITLQCILFFNTPTRVSCTGSD